MQNPDQSNITGTAINYLYVCPRKLWFYQHNLEMEHTSESMDLGKHLHDESYPREKRREWRIDNCVQIDFIAKQVSFTTSNPVRDGNRARHADMLLPLSTQTERRNHPKGIINYPNQRRNTEVELTPKGSAK